MVFDVWTSQSAFDRFSKTLMPILEELSLDPGKPTVMPIHNVITPKAKAAEARPSAKRKKRK